MAHHLTLGIMDHEKIKYTRLIEREGFASLMNDIKWQRVISVLERYSGVKRLKYLGYDAPTDWQKSIWLVSKSYVDCPAGPQRLRLIEWIEIHDEGIRGTPLALEDIDGLTQKLGTSKIVWDNQGMDMRIYGHKRSGSGAVCA
jgi:hypothetical protein